MVSLTVQIIKGNKERYCFNPEAYTGIHTSQKCAKQSFYYYYYYYNDKKKKKSHKSLLQTYLFKEDGLEAWRL